MVESLTDYRWFIAVGLVLVLMALAGSWVRRLPLSSALIYLGVGVVVGPMGLALLVVDPVAHAPAVELVTEIAVIISLFTAGLKLRVPFRDRAWLEPIRLATVSMALTVGLIAAVGVLLLGLPLGAAVLLGAILAPSDPVLASDVQVSHALDRDRVRFTLTGEAGLNDGTAFPFVMLGLGLLGLHELGEAGLRWFAVDLGWAVAVGLGVGAVLGTTVARIVVYLRRRHAAAVGVDELLLIGLIALSYGTALLAGAYGFLAVFAAGLAVRWVERANTADEAAEEVLESLPTTQHETLVAEETAAAAVAESLLRINEALERVAEVGVVILVGAMLSFVGVPSAILWLAPVFFLVVRPVAVAAGLLRSGLARSEFLLTGWFGIRGVGSVYYLAFAITHGLDPVLATSLASLTLGIVAASVLVHGVSVTPLMDRYQRMVEARAARG
jgi:NhaP-type Na+/H+ or K+/H+ antiporter